MWNRDYVIVFCSKDAFRLLQISADDGKSDVEGDEDTNKAELPTGQTITSEQTEKYINTSSKNTVKFVTPRIVSVKIEDSLSAAGLQHSNAPPLQRSVTRIVITKKTPPSKIMLHSKSQGPVKQTYMKGKSLLTVKSKIHLKSPNHSIPQTNRQGNVEISNSSFATQNTVPLPMDGTLDQPGGSQNSTPKLRRFRGVPQARRFVCEYCNYAFANPSALIRHRKKQHTGGSEFSF